MRAFLAAVSCVLTLGLARAADKPNIVFILADDLGEKRNLATLQPEKTAELHAQLLAWRKELRAPMPAPNRSSISTDEKK